jgi:hypothetical protein
MLPTLLLALTCATPAADKPKKAEPPAKKELFAKEKWYKDQKGKEQDFVGVLRYKPRPKGTVGFGRYNAFRLEMEARGKKGKKEVREVYVGSKPELLKPYAGKKVKLVGKPVDMEVEGSKHKEIWPARVELVKGKPAARCGGEDEGCCAEEEVKGAVKAPEKARPKAPKIIARTNWGAPTPKQLVIRSADELARAFGKPGKGKEATKQVAKLFKVDSIDWKKQMVILITAGTKRSGGYSVEVKELKVADKTLTVRWKLNEPKGAAIAVITMPGQAVLVDRFAGKVKFDPAAPKGGKEK